MTSWRPSILQPPPGVRRTLLLPSGPTRPPLPSRGTAWLPRPVEAHHGGFLWHTFENHDNLDVHFESWLGESDAQPDIPPCLEQMQAKGLAAESDGAPIFPGRRRWRREGNASRILVKSDGATPV